VQSQQVEISTGARVFVATKGSGDELVLFLHAVGSDHTSWYLQMEALDDERYTIASYDLRGHGRSAFDVESSIVRDAVSIGGFAKDTIALIEHLGFRRAHLAGISMGAVVALEVFKRRSDVVQSLTLANSATNFPDAESSTAWMQQQLAAKSMAESARELVPKMFDPGAPQELIERAIQIEGGKSRHVYLASWSSMLQCDYRRMVEMIDVPVLLIGGTRDGFTPTDPGLTSIQALIPTAELVDIAGAGHYSNLDHPAEFTRALRAHLLRARSNESQRIGLAGAPAKVKHVFDDAGTAHGYWLLSGRTQAARDTAGVTEAARARVPVLLLRDHTSHVKWRGEDLASALAIANSDPAGPVFVASNDGGQAPSPVRTGEAPVLQPASPAEPSADALDRAARLINAAQRPLVITGALGRYRGGPEALVQFAQRHAVPVIEHGRAFFNFPTRHSMHLGFNPSPFANQADVIIVIESDADFAHRAKVIQIGVAPQPADLTLAGNPVLTIRALTSVLDKSRPDREKIAGRLAAFASEHRRVVQAAQTRAIGDAAKPAITKQFLSYCIGEAIDDRVVVFNDHAADPQLIARRLPDSWFEGTFANAAGAQLAAPDLTMLVITADAPPAVQRPIVTIRINASSGVSSPRELPAAIKRGLEAREPLINVRCESVS
jgi:pimeloyl-ACP methyl ester carboxylesterase